MSMELDLKIAAEVERIIQGIEATADKIALEETGRGSHFDSDEALQRIFEKMFDVLHVFDDTL